MRRIIHLIDADYQDGAFGGVSRFDHELRRALPEMESLSLTRHPFFRFVDHVVWQSVSDDTIVIAGNGDCLMVPDRLKCIVVHHGCAVVHQMRDPSWPGQQYCKTQDEMQDRPNTTFVAPSTFCAEMFKRFVGITPDHVIVHSSDLGRDSALDYEEKSRGGKWVVLGDWRNYNKGEDAIVALNKVADANRFVFKQLSCGRDDKSKVEAYSQAHIYLTLSLSEGCSYSQLDALTLGLPTLSTDVSLFPADVEGRCGLQFPWYLRDDTRKVMIYLNYMRDRFNRYDPDRWAKSKNSFLVWIEKWRKLVDSL